MHVGDKRLSVNVGVGIQSGDGRMGYLPTLDGWRAIAVVMVIFAHAGGAKLFPGLSTYDPFSMIGVEIFFGLSGFLICTRLLAEEREMGRISLSKFYLRRVFRIQPPAWFYLAALAVLAGIGLIAVSLPEFLGSFLLVRNYYPLAVTWYTDHFWSLAVEEHFYLFLPLFLLLAPPQHRLWLLFGFALAGAGWRSFDNRWGGGTVIFPGLIPHHRTDHCLDGLLFGCWTALLAHRWPGAFAGKASLVAGLACILILVSVIVLAGPGLQVVRAFVIPWILIGTVVHPGSPLGRITGMKLTKRG